MEKAERDKENLKNTYNNYFLRVQTLINQKAIGTRSTRKEESKQASKEGPDIEPENKPVVNKEKNTKEVTCSNCGKVFTAARSNRMYCSGACKEAYRRKLKKEV